MNIAKFLGTPILKDIFQRLLRDYVMPKICGHITYYSKDTLKENLSNANAHHDLPDFKSHGILRNREIEFQENGSRVFNEKHLNLRVK